MELREDYRISGWNCNADFGGIFFFIKFLCLQGRVLENRCNFTTVKAGELKPSDKVPEVELNNIMVLFHFCNFARSGPFS